jgi:hypothetical protein
VAIVVAGVLVWFVPKLLRPTLSAKTLASLQSEEARLNAGVASASRNEAGQRGGRIGLAWIRASNVFACARSSGMDPHVAHR